MKTSLVMMMVTMNFAACQSATTPSEGTGGKEAPQAGTVRKKTGETFTIALESNHTTGFSWALDGKEESSVVHKLSDDYINDPHLPGMVGYGGTEHWKFRAEKQGTTVLHFVYRRPWEKGSKPARERSIKVVVE